MERISNYMEVLPMSIADVSTMLLKLRHNERGEMSAESVVSEALLQGLN